MAEHPLPEDSMHIVPLSLITTNSKNLRDAQRDDAGFEEMKNSLVKDGQLTPIIVTPVHNPETGEFESYEVVEGMQRYSASLDLGLETIKITVFNNLSEQKRLSLQIVGNAQRIDTKPAQYSRQLHHLMSLDPSLTVSELAAQLSKSTAWLENILGLSKLCESAAALADDGKITLSNAVALSTIRPEYQDELVIDAQTKPAGEFAEQVRQRRKDINKALSEGRKAEGPKFHASVVYLKKAEVESILSDGCRSVIEAAQASGIDNVEDAIAFGFKAAVQLDDVSLQKRQAAWEAKEEEKRQKREATKARKEREAAARKLEEATAAQAEAEQKAQELGLSN